PLPHQHGPVHDAQAGSARRARAAGAVPDPPGEGVQVQGRGVPAGRRRGRPDRPAEHDRQDPVRAAGRRQPGRRDPRGELAGLELRHRRPHRRRDRPDHQDVGGPAQDDVHHGGQLRRADPPAVAGPAAEHGGGLRPHRRHSTQTGRPRLRVTTQADDRGSARPAGPSGTDREISATLRGANFMPSWPNGHLGRQNMWDPTIYLRYANERGRPFVDLVSRIGAEDPAVVVDLGCGPGTLTTTLAERWPGARIIGLDSSAEMIMQAKALDTNVVFELDDLRDYTP